jgi:hypothetical protein
MSLKLGKPKMPPSEPRTDEERETREAVVQDADKNRRQAPRSCARRWRDARSRRRRRFEQGLLEPVSREWILRIERTARPVEHKGVHTTNAVIGADLLAFMGQ